MGRGYPPKKMYSQEKRFQSLLCPTSFQSLKETPREQETYATILALMNSKNVIGLQPVKVFTDHKTLQEWVKETLDTPGGPVGRRSRWYEILSKFDLEVEYMPFNTNMVAYALRRWAYPASQAARDVTEHETWRTRRR